MGMNDEKWGDLIFMVREKFGLEAQSREPIIEQGEAETRVVRGEREILEFKTPEGRIRVERESRPLVLDKKYQYHKGSAGRAQVSYTYSETEKTHTIRAFRQRDGEWVPLEGGMPFGS